ncbi:MAG: hypothetical protein B7Z83_10985, partial [Thiomonas sp. 20-64-5]
MNESSTEILARDAQRVGAVIDHDLAAIDDADAEQERALMDALGITGTALTSLSGLGHTVIFNGPTVVLDIADAGNTFTADQSLSQSGGLTKLGAKV